MTSRAGPHPRRHHVPGPRGHLLHPCRAGVEPLHAVAARAGDVGFPDAEARGDRSRADHPWLVWRTLLHRLCARRPVGPATAGHAPVSYTHLTLPPISSV